jgi:transposase
MKKRTYRAVNVKRLSVESLWESVHGRRVVFGVDVAKEGMVGTVLADGDLVLNVRWQHPVETKDLVELLGSLPSSSLEVAMEPSGTYGDALRYQFLKRGIPVYRVSSKRSHDAAEVYDGVPSWHDVKSAGVVAKLHVDGASGEWGFRSDADRELTAAIRTMEMYDDQEERNVNRLEALLARHWPELTHYLSLTSMTLAELIKEFGGPGGVGREPSRARRLIRRVGRCGVRENAVNGLLESAKTTLGVPLIEAEEEALRELASEIVRCREAARRARKAVERLSDAHEAARQMSQVVGKATAAVLVSSVGDPRQYESANSLIRSMGLNLKERSSGKYKGQLKITKRGPSVCRYYLYLAALRLIQDDPVTAAWYAKKVSRDGGRVKNKGVIAVMRKLAKALWHVARGARFDSRLLFDVSRLDLVTT